MLFNGLAFLLWIRAKKPENKEIRRDEEPTKSLTLDRMDRSMKVKGDSKKELKGKKEKNTEKQRRR